MADRATQAGRDMLVDKKAVSNTGRSAYQEQRRHLSGRVGEKAAAVPTSSSSGTDNRNRGIARN